MLLLMALLLTPALAVAQKKVAAAKPSAVTDVKKDLAEGEFERALKKADAAVKKSTDAAELAQLHLIRGQALMALGKADKARAAFAAALQKDPTAELDASRASPDAVRLFEKARAELPATLSVHIEDGEGTLTIDDKDMGPAPLQTQVGAGKHVVEARTSDGRSTRKEVDVPPGRKLEVALKLGGGLKTPVVDTPPPPPPTHTDTMVPPPPPMPLVAAPQKPARSKAGLGPLIGGVVVAGGGAVALWQANVQYARLTAVGQPRLSPADEAAAVSNGKLFQTLGWVGVGVGAAAIATGALMLALAPAPKPAEDPDARVGVIITPGGAWIGVSGRLP